MKRHVFFVILLAIFFTDTASADEAHETHVEVSIDTYVALNPNNPTNRSNFLHATGTSAKRAHELSLNAVSVELARDPTPLGFSLLLSTGTSSTAMHENEAHEPSSPALWEFIHDATISYRIHHESNLVVTAGVMPSHIGFETFFAKDNWNYTRSWIADFTPYYLTGVRTSWNMGNNWSAHVFLVNGWKSIGDDNNGKSFGFHIAFDSNRLNMKLDALFGPERDHTGSAWTSLGDFVAKVKIKPWWQLAYSTDIGSKHADQWHSSAVWSRWELSTLVALALRGEYFHDPHGLITGESQTLYDGTVTLELKPKKHLITRLEGRYDSSTKTVFANSTGTANTKHQPLLVWGLMATF